MRSRSSTLAVTMMMGTAAVFGSARSARQTSSPLSAGQHQVQDHQVDRDACARRPARRSRTRRGGTTRSSSGGSGRSAHRCRDRPRRRGPARGQYAMRISLGLQAPAFASRGLPWLPRYLDEVPHAFERFDPPTGFDQRVDRARRHVDQGLIPELRFELRIGQRPAQIAERVRSGPLPHALTGSWWGGRPP